MGSYTWTNLTANTAQDNVVLNDNTLMDIPGSAFMNSTQMLVKTVDVKDQTDYKPLGAAISFEFTNEKGDPVHPATALLIRNFIGIGLKSVVLMHITASGENDYTYTAKVIKTTDEGYQATIDGMN
jgi:hypothetical protein